MERLKYGKAGLMSFFKTNYEKKIVEKRIEIFSIKNKKRRKTKLKL